MTQPSTMGTWFGDLALAWLYENGCWVSLHTGYPTAAGLLSTEVAGGGYARQYVTWAAPSGKAIATNSSVQFNGLQPNVITYIGAWDADSAGDFIGCWLLDPPLTIAVVNTFPIPAGDLAIALP